jgi:drug/metabolite transporter (DMT)-like permease
MFSAFLSTLLFSVSVVCGHRSAKLIGGSEANFWRLALAALFLGVWSFATGVGLGGAALPMFLLSGVVGIGVGDVGLFQTLPRLGSRLSLLLIHCLGAPCAALIEWLWLRTPLSPAQVLCGITILMGVGLALSPGRRIETGKTGKPVQKPQAPALTQLKLGVNENRDRREKVIGVLFAMLGAIGNAFGAVLSRKAYSIAHENQEIISGHDAAFQRIAGGLAVAGICLLLVKRDRFWVRARDAKEENSKLQTPSSRETSNSKLQSEAVVSSLPGSDSLSGGVIGALEEQRARVAESAALPSDLHRIGQKWLKAGPWILANSFAGQTIGVSCMQKAFETTPTGLVLSIVATTPIVVMPLTYLFEGERPTKRSIAGGVVAVAGVVALVISRG